jgi:hypothetical protein
VSAMNSYSAIAITSIVLLFYCQSCSRKHNADGGDARDTLTFASEQTEPLPTLGGGSDSAAILAASSIARRHGDSLFIRLRSGGARVLVDNPIDDRGAIAYRFRGQIARPFLLFQLGLYEDELYLIMNDSSGNQIEIDGPPVFSRNSRRFVTATPEESHFDTRLCVWCLTDSVPVVEWSIEPKEWWPRRARWLNDSTVEFESVNLESKHSANASRQLVLRNGRWALRPVKR